MTQTDHTFWMDDLNYRIDPFTHGLVKPAVEDKKGPVWPKSGTPEHAEIGTKVRELIDKKQLGELAKHDELKAAMSNGEVLATFSEGDISKFMPTFKVVPARKYEKDVPPNPQTGKVPDPKDEPLHYTWQRWPAWCDRILGHSRPHVKSAVKQLEYTSLPTVMTSDHKPVMSIFDVDLFPPAPELPDTQPDDAPDLWLSNLKASNLKAVDLTGKSDPYLFFWAPEIGITNETQGGWIEGTTNVKLQTLNPEWNDDEIPTLKILTADESLIKESYLVISFLDHDNLDQDDDMGCVTLALKDFVNKGGDTFTAPVYCNGMHHGELSGHLQIRWPDANGKRKTRRKKSALCNF